MKKSHHEIILFSLVAYLALTGPASAITELLLSDSFDTANSTTQLYRRLTAAEAKRQLLERGYAEEDVPSERSLCRMLGKLGFKPRRVAKSKPLRKVAQTDAIFETVHQINAEADADPGTIRISIDTKNHRAHRQSQPWRQESQRASGARP